MPMYDYSCEDCGASERLVKYDERDSQVCSCGKPLARDEIATVTVRSQGMRYQPRAIFDNGAKVAGHFGTVAKKNKLGWR